MRERARFRVWNGMEMVYDVVVGRFGAFYVNPGERGDGLNPKDTACLTEFNTKYSAETPVMQSTGLLDRNGKEIYEGDVVKSSASNDPVCEVYWRDEVAGFEFVSLKKDGWSWMPNTDATAYYWEIIGNQYENPQSPIP